MTTNADRMKFAAAALLFALWGWLVYVEKTSAAELVEGIKYALIGLGVFHATQSQPPSPPAPPVSDAAPALPQQQPVS